jgi:hypothetical protein
MSEQHTHKQQSQQEMFPALSGASSTPSAATKQSESFLLADSAKKRHQAVLARKEQDRIEFLRRQAQRDARKAHKRTELIHAQLKKNPFAHIRCILYWYLMLPGGEDLRIEKDLEEDRIFQEAEWAEQERREEEAIEEERMSEIYFKKCEEERALADSEGRLEEYEQYTRDVYEHESLCNWFSQKDIEQILKKKDAMSCPFCHEFNNSLRVLA